MQKQSGNFLLQALLALTLVFSFMPFVARQLAGRDRTAQMYAAKQSIETIHNAARLYLYDNKDTLPYGSYRYTGDELVNLLHPYGLPLGFNTVTSLGQHIGFSIDVGEPVPMPCDNVVGELEEEHACDDVPDVLLQNISARLVVRSEDLRRYQLAELARMIGFFAKQEDGVIEITVPVDVMYTDVVLRKETDEHVGFLTELDMGGCRCQNPELCRDLNGNCCPCDIDTVKTLYAEDGVFTFGKMNHLCVGGRCGGQMLYTSDMEIRDGVNITNLQADTFTFRPIRNTNTGLLVKNAAEINVANNVKSDFINSTAELFGSFETTAATNFNTNFATVGEIKHVGNFSSCCCGDAGSSCDVGSHCDANVDAQCEWVVKGTLNANTKSDTDNFKFDSNLLYSKGSMYIGRTKTEDHLQDATFVGEGLGIKLKNNVDSNKIMIVNGTWTDFESSEVDMSVDVGGTSMFQDIYVERFTDKSNLPLLVCPFKQYSSGGVALTHCSNLIADYNPKSLKQAIVCQYMFWHRLEHRVNQKLCALSGYCTAYVITGECSLWQH